MKAMDYRERRNLSCDAFVSQPVMHPRHNRQLESKRTSMFVTPHFMRVRVVRRHWNGVASRTIIPVTAFPSGSAARGGRRRAPHLTVKDESRRRPPYSHTASARA
jgi:hypothetical protein